MTLTKPNQELRRDLQGLASDLKWSAVELMRIAELLSQAGNEHDAQAVIRICQVMHAGEGRLVGYGDEVKGGESLDQIMRDSGVTSRPCQADAIIKSFRHH